MSGGADAGVRQPTAALVSFRFGGLDGVAIETAKWEHALSQLGWRTYRIAGELADGVRHGDVVVPGLAIGADGDPALLEAALDLALRRADLVIVENLLSLPLNTLAAMVLTRVLRRRRLPSVLHHHDLPWQRPLLPQPESLPPPPSLLPRAVHVTINEHSRRELAARGIPATTIRNRFEELRSGDDRDRVRAELDVAATDLVLLQPTRAILRKNVPGGVHFAEQLQELAPSRRVVYWLTGPAEEGYGATLGELLRGAGVAVRHRPVADRADAYAAADIVVFPSFREGFGNPVVESVWARRPVVTGSYPALEELRDLGLRTLPLSRPQEAAALLHGGDAAMLNGNLAVVRRHLSLARLPDDLRALFAAGGWSRLAAVDRRTVVTGLRRPFAPPGTPGRAAAHRRPPETIAR